MNIFDKKCLVIVPARGGSKGIPKKNLSEINGLSLIALAAKLVNKIHWIDKSIISSDSNEMIEEGLRHGLDSIFVRPSEISDDNASAISVWSHALREAEKKFNQKYDISLFLEPTSPFRTETHLEVAVSKLINGSFDSVITVSETDSKSHPLKQFTFKNQDEIEFYTEEAESIVSRQQLEQLYHRNGIAYVATRDCILNKKEIVSKNTAGVLIKEAVVNIDTPIDLEWARFLWSKLPN